MGLLDLLSAPDTGNGVGGLLSYLNSPLYRSPLLNPQPQSQPQYDALGNYTGVTQDAPNPFGPLPQTSQPSPASFQPPSVFSSGTLPVTGIPALGPQTSTSAPPAASLPAPNAAPPVQAPSIAQPAQVANIGGYQMPQFGTTTDYTPKSAPRAPTDVSSQSRSTPEPDIGVGDRLMAGIQNFANAGGPLQALAGGLSGLVSGQRTDPQGMQQQALSSNFKALVEAGVPRNLAMAAALNPKVFDQIAPQYFGKNELVDGGTDPLTGQKRFFWKNGADQTLTPANPTGEGSASSTQGMQSLNSAIQAGVKGDALYGYLPPGMAPTVKAMIEGRQQMPSTVAMRSPAILALIDAAHTIDPTFDATTWAARAAGRKDFEGGGKSSEMVRAANQTLSHVGSLMDAMDRLNNTRFPAVNSVKNFANEQTGGGEPGSFRTNAHAVAEEMSKVFKGANLSDAEIRHWEQNLSENMSPEQQRAQIAKLSELLHGSLNALEEKRVSSMGPMAAANSGPLIKEAGQKVLERIDSWLNNNGAPAPSSGPKVGTIQMGYRFKGGNPADRNSWEKVQ